MQILLTSAGCIEKNPGPPLPKKINFGCWNVDSLLAREKHKINVIEGLNAYHKFDLFGICESHLSPSIGNETITINGFSRLLIGQI